MPNFLFEGREVEAEDGESVLGALLRHGADVGHGCKAGACQSCLLRSSGAVPSSAQNGLDETLIERGAFLSCQAGAGDVCDVERLGREVFPRFQATLQECRRVADEVLFLRFDVPGWSAAPGRFVRMVHPSGTVRPYSLATPAWNPPTEAHFHVRLIEGGEMSQALADSQPGDVVELEGPFGKCSYRLVHGNEPILLIGSGTGLAPLYGIATDALHRGHNGPVHLFHGGRTSASLYFRDELSDLAAKYPGFRTTPCADEDVTGDDLTGSPLDHALREHPDLTGYKVYLCGHPMLVKAAQKKCFLAGANLRDIAADPFVPA
ncbi:MAG: 2Fe-2S iron-sulfur cluster binding domain-containing protein [Armatimonadetes bacterium]|nr:2Fe-2S iron-sulfur cluster binding domain-containing protein [Armatimonadota bacterium]